MAAGCVVVGRAAPVASRISLLYSTITGFSAFAFGRFWATLFCSPVYVCVCVCVSVCVVAAIGEANDED